MTDFRIKTSRYLTLRLGFNNLVVTSIILYFADLFHRNPAMQMKEQFQFPLATLSSVSLGILSANVLMFIINTTAERTRLLRLVLTEIAVFSYMLLFAYRSTTHIPLDISVIADNFGEGLSATALETIYASFIPNNGSTVLLAAIPKVMLGIAAMDFIVAKLSRPSPRGPFPFQKAATALSLYAAMLLAPFPTHDEVLTFVRNSYRFAFEVDPIEKSDIDGYPYVKITNGESSALGDLAPGDRKPNVILVLVESFNANFINKKSPEGLEYTPVFNSMIKKGVFVERFYGNSVQTAKGHATVMLSVHPSIRGKIMKHFPNLNFKGLPRYFSEAGYSTHFIQGNKKLDFDNTRSFYERAGMQEVHSGFEFMKKGDEKSIWGWGPEDGLLYRRTLEYLDGFAKMTPTKPIFAVIGTVSSHMPFKALPEAERTLFKAPKTIAERYANSIHFSDSRFTDLFDAIKSRPYLKNTIVVITGDHSFPIDEHGISHNEQGFYEESFRTPFLIVWKDKLKPKSIVGPYSQVDIAPTLLDLAGIRHVKTHFVGDSIFSPNRSKKKIYLVQPYSGQYLEVVDFPLKYIYHRQTGAEYLFDLLADPAEKDNIVDRTPAETLVSLRNEVKKIYLNQNIIRENKLWPK